MSASDCDGSLDWLSTGREDGGSLSDLGRERAAPGRTFPSPRRRPREGRGGRELKEEGDGAPSSSTEPSAREGDGILSSGPRERSAPAWPSLSPAVAGEKCGQARKRQRGTTTLLRSTQEWTDDRDELFARKLGDATGAISGLSTAVGGGHRTCDFLDPKAATRAASCPKRKCSQLQCYIPPLSSILNGLRSGRYRERLSTFQESVAMDRIQRIMGVLQNRCTGERYVSIVLKVEEMLKNWFPDIRPREEGVVEQDGMTPSKKLKPSAATEPVAVANPVPPGAFPPSTAETVLPGAYSATHTKWLHTSPICSPTVELTLGRLAPCDKDATQDSAVSSSTDAKPAAPAARPPLGKINAPCLERLLKSTESIITCRSSGGASDGSQS